MRRSRLDPAIVRPLKTIFEEGAIGLRSDAELLDRCARSERDEAAFTALVERHRAMVLRVCRGMLGDPNAAEDAAQATFLVLARKAGSVRRGETIAPWLHGVAVRVSAKMRVVAARRRKHEQIAAERRGERWTPAPVDDIGPLLHEELGRLPEKYRAPVVLCHLDGLSHEEAARRLGWPVGTVRGRLARARDRLRDRLKRRGLAPSAGFLAALSGTTTEAAVTSTWVHSTVAAALNVSATGPVAAGAVPVAVSDVANDIIKEIFMTKAKMIGALVLVSGVVASGAVGFAQFGGSGSPTRPEPRPAPKIVAGKVSSVEAPEVEIVTESIQDPAPAAQESGGLGSAAQEAGGFGFGASEGTGPVSVWGEIHEIEDDPDAVDALVEVALMDLALAKMNYEEAISRFPVTDSDYPIIRDTYIDAVTELSSIRSLLRQLGVSPEDLPPIAMLEKPEAPRETADN